LARAKIASLVVNLWQKEVLPDGKFLANLWQISPKEAFSSGKFLANAGKNRQIATVLAICGK